MEKEKNNVGRPEKTDKKIQMNVRLPIEAIEKLEEIASKGIDNYDLTAAGVARKAILDFLEKYEGNSKK